MEHKLNTELKNQHGKPIYPKLVTDKYGNRVRVFNPEHEAEVTGKLVGKEEKPKKEKEIKEENKDNKSSPEWK